MSKVVRGVGRAVGKVVKGVVKVVKSVATSKFQKLIRMAALIYFGGAALSGALSSGGTAAGAVANAATSLGTAGSELMAGNFANAAGAIGSGIQGGAATMVDGALSTSGMGGAATNTVATQVADGAITNPLDARLANGTATSPGVVPQAPPGAPGGSGIVGNALSSAGKFMSENKLWTPAMLIGGNMMSGYFQNKQRLDEIARQRQSIIDGYRSGFGQSLWKA